MAKISQAQMEKRWQKIKEQMGYTDEEIAIVRSNPEYVKIMEYAPKFLTHRIVIEVIEAHNCGAGHKPGDRIAVMTGNAFLLPKEMPKRVCAFALYCAIPRIYAIWERFHEDLNPANLFLTKVHCPDVGCRRGGWGEVVLKVFAEEIPKEERIKPPAQ